MTSPLINMIMQYSAPAFAGIIIGLLFKMYFASQAQKKIRGYQGEIIKSHSRILKLEELNGRLENRLKEVEQSFCKDRLYMN